MATLEVCHLRLVACFHQGVESSLDQGGYTTTKHSLLTKEVGLCLFLECGFKDTCTTCTKTLCISKCYILGIAAGILVDCNQGRNTLAFLELGADRVARTLGCDHDNVHVRWRCNLAEVDVESMCECEVFTRGQIFLDAVMVDLCLSLIRQQHHDDLSHGTCFLSGCNLQACFFSNLPAL